MRPRLLLAAERRYLLDAAQGLTADESANRHHVSINTVRTQLGTGKAALGARTIAHATALCLVLGEFTSADVRAEDIRKEVQP